MDVNRRCEISCVRESLPLYLLYANWIYNNDKKIILFKQYLLKVQNLYNKNKGWGEKKKQWALIENIKKEHY